MKSRVIVFVSVVYFITTSQALGGGQDEDVFQRSNYYTNDQGTNVGEMQNQGKTAAKRQDKKVEHFRNSHAKYHEPKRYNVHRDEHRAHVIHQSSDYRQKVADGRNNIEKRSQLRRGDSRVAGQSDRGHFHIPSDRVRYHDGVIGPSQVHSSHPRITAQRQVRKSFNEQGNWRWGFRRKQSKDHPLKDANSFSRGDHYSYRGKESVNGRNAHSEAMVRNGHLGENGDAEGIVRQNSVRSEFKMANMKNPVLEHQKPYAPKQEISDDCMNRAMGQQGLQRWDSKERAEGNDYQWDTIQKANMPPTPAKLVHDGQRNSINVAVSNSKEIQSAIRNQPFGNRNDLMRGTHPNTEYNQELYPVENKALNPQIESEKVEGLTHQIPSNQFQYQKGEIRNTYENTNQQLPNIAQIPNSLKMDDPRFDQCHNSNLGYDTGLNNNLPRIENEQQPENIKFEAEAANPRMEKTSGNDVGIQQNQWDDGSPKINAHRMKVPNSGMSKPNAGNAARSTALDLQIEHQQQTPGQPVRPQAEEIRYVVLSPAEFNPETLRLTLGEPEKPRGIPYCTLEEYKMESANLKAKAYDAHERDMRYSGKGSINELISRLKRNNHPSSRGCGRRLIKSRASGEGPEMPVHSCTATPSICEPSIGTVTQTEAIGEATSMCWVESLTRPTISIEDLGINYRITPSYSYDHLRGRLPVISQFDYTAGTSCSTPCEEPKGQKQQPTTTRGKRKRHVHFFHNHRKRTPDEILLSDIIRELQNSTVIAPRSDPQRILPNAPEEERIIEKYLTALMEEQINRPKNQIKSAAFKVGHGWLENLFRELAENKLRSKIKMYQDKRRLEHNKDHTHS